MASTSMNPVEAGKSPARTSAGAIEAQSAGGGPDDLAGPGPVEASENLSLKERILGPLQQVLAQPAVRRAMPAIIVVLVVLVFMLLYSYISAPTYRVLFPGMQEADRQTALDTLSSAGFDVRIARGSGELEVREARYHEARIFLAGRGLPATGVSGGFDALGEQSSMTTSQFMEQARYQAAIERELAQTISQITSIASARVHLAVARQTPFVRERVPPKASVTVTPHPGRLVTESQVRAIVNLVAAAVPYLAAEHVAVVDHLGNLLTDTRDDGLLGLTGGQLALKRSVENEMRERVLRILAPVFGEQNVRAQADVTLDFTQIESTHERFDNERQGPLTRSEILAEERSGRLDALGIPGATSNLPPPDVEFQPDARATVEGEEGRDGIFNRRSTRNYELDRSVEHVRRATGAVQRVSIAVVVNERQGMAGQQGTGLTDEQIRRFVALVRGAVGADERRGDQVTFVMAPFEPLPKVRDPLRWWENPIIIDILKSLMMVAIFVAIIFWLIRPVVYSFLGPPEPTEEEKALLAATAALSAEESDMIEMQDGESLEQVKARLKPKKSAISLELLDTANSYDDKVALIRMIVSEDSGRMAKVLKNMIRVI